MIGSYSVQKKEEMGLVDILLKIDGVEEIQYYTIQNEAGSSLISEEIKMPITDGFTYLGFLSTELDHLKVECYSTEETKKYTAYFDSLTYEIYVLEEE